MFENLIASFCDSAFAKLVFPEPGGPCYTLMEVITVLTKSTTLLEPTTTSETPLLVLDRTARLKHYLELNSMTVCA
jgi:hypothetical protein